MMSITKTPHKRLDDCLGWFRFLVQLGEGEPAPPCHSDGDGKLAARETLMRGQHLAAKDLACELKRSHLTPSFVHNAADVLDMDALAI